MTRRFKRTALGLMAAGAVALSTPALAAPMSLRAFAEQQVRVATIGYRLEAANANRCAKPQMMTGMLLHDLSQYDPTVRPSVSQAFSLGSGFGIIQIVPGSAAQRAGLRIDDEIIAVRGVSVEDPAAVVRSGKSYRRMEWFAGFLQGSLQNGPTELLVRRGGAPMRVTLRGEAGCGGEPSLLNSNEQNAWSDGNHVAITTGMLRLAKSDDEIAFVMAHEMSHNLLGHSHSSASQIFGARRSEIVADQMAVGLMTYAGYQPNSGISFLETARRRFWWSSLSLDHPGFGSRIRAVTAAIAALPPRQWQVAASRVAPSPTPAAVLSTASAASAVVPPSYARPTRAVALASFSD
jgi:beta-barrel assembly-enhancing protease